MRRATRRRVRPRTASCAVWAGSRCSVGRACRAWRRLRSAWIDATDPDEQKRICREIQLQALQDVPYIPLGAFFFASAYRSDLTGVLKGSIPMFTNVRRT